ncbi:MAG: RyR domain-containing protein [bacterium]|nr:RyR domain-containing protein [bacterium]
MKQVAEFVQPGTIEPVTFNLSQLDGPSDLLGAFHQVRDISLKGKLPLVFWDEFDTSLAGDPLGWLRYFLAPMQDGEFQEGQITHPIGRVIFAFAGGTAERMSAFGKGVPAERQKALKLPDFTSRLRGFLDVLGPNRQTTTRSTDPYFVIRRAILLRSLFERVTGQVIRNGELQIDRGVLRALLRVETYRHGARSIESLLSTSLLVGESRFNRSSLPPEAQLDLHVDAQEFLALVHLLELEGELLDGAARAIHDGFCRSREADGYRFGEKTDDAAMTHSALRPFDELPLNEQEQNRDAARDIPRKLATRRYVMMPDRRDESRFEFPNDDLDALAAAEHQRWMDKKLVDGWTPAPELEVPDKDNKRHPDLVPYEDLSDKEQEKDREQIRELVDVLAAVGYTVVRLRDRDPGTN